MGCSQSKIENEEAVSRCKDRKAFMKAAVTSRNAFAAAHVAYSMSLKNAGAALSDFAQGEVLNPLSYVQHHSSTPPSVVGGPTVPPPPPSSALGTLPPPPPPVPDMPPPLQRAVSMPEFVVSKPVVRGGVEGTIEEEEEVEEEEEEEVGRLRRRRESKGGSVGGRIETPGDGGGGSMSSSSVANNVVGPPPPPVERETRTPPPPPPMPEMHGGTWDYFFNTDDMPGGSLRDVEEMRSEREEYGGNVVYHQRAMRSGGPQPGVTMMASPLSSEEVEEMMVPGQGAEKPPLPPMGGRVLKKGKQMMGRSVSEGGTRKNVYLVQIFSFLDDCFLRASESAQLVSKLLEATRLHYHSNFADNRGHIDHSARVMRVITWNRSFRGLSNAEEAKDDFDSEENETHATVLDKLLAWEKKLYDEVKAGEIMKFEYQKKVALLNKQKNRGSSSESLEKSKAAVSHLHTRYIVDMQSLDSTVSEISRLRDEQLYPKLVALVDAMATMWGVMQLHHQNQLKISADLRLVDISQSTKETTDDHHKQTVQLWGIFQEWNTQFDKMVNYQKDYIRSLSSWLKLNLIPIESNLKEKVSSPPRVQNPPIQGLLIAWHDHLEKLPDEHAKSAIYNFAAVLQTIVQQQEDEIRLRAKVQESRRDLEKKERHYNKWFNEYMQKKTPTDAGVEDDFHKDELMVEKEVIVETAKRKLEEDTEEYERQCIQVREKSLTNLKTRLPELFRSLSEFAVAACDMYSNLKALAHSSQSRKHKETSTS